MYQKQQISDHQSLIFWPVMSIFFIFCYNKKNVKVMENPYHRFITSTCSNLTFLVLIILSINLNEDRFKYIGLGVVDMMLMFWPIALFSRVIQTKIRKLHLLRQHRANPFQKKFWLSRYVFDYFIFACFVIWIACQICINTIKELRGMSSDTYVTLMPGKFYFAIGTLLSFIRLISVFQTNRSLGMLLMTLQHLLWESAKFIVIFCFILAAFALAITSLYSHHNESIQMLNDTKLEQPNTKFSG